MHMGKPQIFAFADEACPQIDGQISAMRRNGLDGLEIRGVDGTNVSAITLEKAREVRQKMDDNGLKIWSVGSPIGKIRLEDSFDAHLDVFRHTLEVADILGAANMRMFSFYLPGGQDPDRFYGQVVDRLGAMLDVARGSGVTLCHENEKGIFGDTARRCLRLLEALPELKGVFDPANFVQCGDDTAAGWAILKDHTYYLHIKDSLPDGNVVPAGLGAGNVACIVRDFLDRGGCAMTIEPHLTVFDGLKDLEQDGNTSAVGRHIYPSADAAFDAACQALKKILE